MSFQPVVPFGGMAGWAFLQRTADQQRDTFAQDPQVQRDLDYFKQNIGNVTSAEELVGNYRLLKVALGAFGLDDDIGNKYFIQKVLEDGTEADDALANKLTDKRYFALAEAFGFGEGEEPATVTTAFTEPIPEGEDGEGGFRLTAGIAEELAAVADSDATRDARWQAVIENPRLRQLFATALNLPEAFEALPTDRQVEAFRTATEQAFGYGEVGQFTDDAAQAKLTRLYLAYRDIDATETTTSALADSIAEAYITRQFEIAVGEQDTDMRLALSLERELGAIVEADNTDDGRWYAIMGNEPLRTVFETALGLPSDSFGSLDIDLQLTSFRARAQSIFGDGEVSQFSAPEKLEELNRLFLARAQVAESGTGMSSATIALTLLGGG